MGCFLACFGGDEDKKRRRRPNRSLPPHQRNEKYPRRRSPSPKKLAHGSLPELRLGDELEQDGLVRASPLKEILLEEVADESVLEQSIGEKPEPEQEQPPSESPPRKLLLEVVANDSVSELSSIIDGENPEQGTPLCGNCVKEVVEDSVSVLSAKSDQEGSTSSRKKVTFDLNVTTIESPAYDELRSSQEEEEEEAVTRKTDGEAATSPCAYPSNHRYQDCASSDDEDINDEEDYDDSDDDDDDDEDDGIGIAENEEESYESFFSLPLEKEGKSFAEVNSPTQGVQSKGNARDRSQYVHSVLNPVENLSKWKEVKDRSVPAKNPKKENAKSEQVTTETCLEPTINAKSPTKPHSPVDTSLSSWLVTQENLKLALPAGSNSVKSNSSISREDQPILGALTIEDIKQTSVTSSPRKSPSRSPEDMPIVGSVGSYWNSSKGDDSTATSRARSVGIPNTTSKYREDKRVNWHSSPFEERLERALKEGSAAETCSRMPSAAVF